MEEKGYWFSLENGTHIHAEEGESPKEAVGKRFTKFKGEKKTEPKTEPTSLGKGIDNLVKESADIDEKSTASYQINENEYRDNLIRVADRLADNAEAEIRKSKDPADKYGLALFVDGRKLTPSQVEGLLSGDDLQTVNKKLDEKEQVMRKNMFETEPTSLGKGIDNMVEESTQEGPELKEEIDKTANEIISSGNDYASQMLGRLTSDVNYVLGSMAETRKSHPEWFHSDKKEDLKHLWYNGDVEKHIGLMKRLVDHLNKNGIQTKTSAKDVEDYRKKLNDYVKEDVEEDLSNGEIKELNVNDFPLDRQAGVKTFNNQFKRLKEEIDKMEKDVKKPNANPKIVSYLNNQIKDKKEAYKRMVKELESWKK